MKTIHFSCPVCERPVETPAEMSGRVMSCPICEESLRPPRPAPKASSSWLIILCFWFVMIGVCIGIPVERRWSGITARTLKPEDSRAQYKRLQAEAQAILLPKCTNAIVGLNRIISKDLSIRDEDPNKWTAEVTAEYVNHFGGIDRTNLPMVFWVYDSPVDETRHVQCRIDTRKIYEAERDALSRKFGHALSAKPKT
jgi:hypothetical protein